MHMGRKGNVAACAAPAQRVGEKTSPLRLCILTKRLDPLPVKEGDLAFFFQLSCKINHVFTCHSFNLLPGHYGAVAVC